MALASPPAALVTIDAPRTSLVSVEGGRCVLMGNWNVQALAIKGEVSRRRKALSAAEGADAWDLSRVGLLDAVGAQLLWQYWGQKIPPGTDLSPGQQALFQILADHPSEPVPQKVPTDRLAWIVAIGAGVFVLAEHGQKLLLLLGGVLLDFAKLVRHPLRGPWREISAQVYRVGTQALGITALVGFLIGVVLSYLSAQQLAVFGAGQFIVKLLGIATVRELGPVLAAILVAGRSGSSITAQIGVMRVTQELDAMQVMGISHGQRLILPRVIALAIAMPLLVLWTDALALLGGMIAAKFELDLSMQWFFSELPDAVGITNYKISLIKGVTFGVWIALIACHFGLRIEPNTESLGRGTTASVVTAITGVILIDALYGILFDEMRI
ncbi:Ttg2B ABC-type transport system involved in resistance to organic solvents, permease component [Burkholderiaceae bacterium]